MGILQTGFYVSCSNEDYTEFLISIFKDYVELAFKIKLIIQITYLFFIFLYSKACKEPSVSSRFVMLSSISDDVKGEGYK